MEISDFKMILPSKSSSSGISQPATFDAAGFVFGVAALGFLVEIL
jgi:hypothetical protein